MRAVVQRVVRASVRFGGEVVGEVGTGLCVLAGVTHDDTTASAGRLARRLWNLRIFPDEDGIMDRPVADVGGQILVVSQFTLYADAGRGRRPSWAAAAPPEVAEPLIDRLVGALREHGATVATGRFGAHMTVEIHNDGPVTIILDS